MVCYGLLIRLLAHDPFTVLIGFRVAINVFHTVCILLVCIGNVIAAFTAHVRLGDSLKRSSGVTVWRSTRVLLMLPTASAPYALPVWRRDTRACSYGWSSAAPC